jgi:hypothetical protein
MLSRYDQDLELPQSIAALGSDRFVDVLLEELEQISGELPLEEMCRDGGWPDESTLEISIGGVRKEGGKLYVSVKCAFDEVLPTGCADVTRTESGFGEVEIIFDLLQETAYIRHESEF